MRNKLTVLVIFFILFSKKIFSNNSLEMDNFMRSSGKIYVVIAVLLLIFVGIIIYLIRIDKKVSKLEKQIRNS